MACCSGTTNLPPNARHVVVSAYRQRRHVWLSFPAEKDLSPCAGVYCIRRRLSVTSVSMISLPRRTATFTLSPGLCLRRALSKSSRTVILLSPKLNQHVAALDARLLGRAAFENGFEQHAVGLPDSDRRACCQRRADRHRRPSMIDSTRRIST